MVNVFPFRGLRPVPEHAQRLASPPYDVISSEEARTRCRDNPYSFLRVIKPEVDFEPTVNPFQKKVYEKGKSNLLTLMNRRILLRDRQPCFYLYKQILGQHRQTGLVAVVPVDDYLSGKIKKHEHTQPDKVRDRAELIRTLGAQTGPVFLTYRRSAQLQALSDEAMQTEPVYNFSNGQGVQHVFYVIDKQSLIEEIRQAFKEIDFLYIADGHHRSEAAAKVCLDLRREHPDYTASSPFNYFLSVIFPHDEMMILPYNRVLKDLNNLTPDELLARLEKVCHLQSLDVELYQPEQLHTLGMYMDKKWYRLSFLQRPEDDPVQSLDVTLLQEHILKPLFNILDARNDKRIKFVGGLDSVSQLKQLVDSGEFAVGFSLHPTGIEQVMRVADAGQVMPPKSTWFEPKLLSGLVTHLLDEE